MPRTVHLLWPATLLAASSFWMLEQVESSLRHAGVDTRSLPPLVLNGLEAWGTDPQGRLRQHLYARRVQQQPAGGGTDILQPDLALFEGERRLWAAVAAHGHLDAAQSALRLYGGVHCERPADARVPSLTLNTPELTWRPGQSLVEGEGALFVQGGGHRLQAIGFRARLADDILELLSDVRGTFIPVQAGPAVDPPLPAAAGAVGARPARRPPEADRA